MVSYHAKKVCIKNDSDISNNNNVEIRIVNFKYITTLVAILFCVWIFISIVFQTLHIEFLQYYTNQSDWQLLLFYPEQLSFGANLLQYNHAICSQYYPFFEENLMIWNCQLQPILHDNKFSSLQPILRRVIVILLADIHLDSSTVAELTAQVISVKMTNFCSFSALCSSLNQ